MKIKNTKYHRWNDKLADHVISIKYKRSKNIMNRVPSPSPLPYPPCHRLMGDNYYYYKGVQRKISIYNKSL